MHLSKASVGLKLLTVLTEFVFQLYVIRFEKTDHVCTTSEMHFVAPYHIYYSKHSDKITRGGQVCYSTWHFLGHAKH